MRWGGEPIRLTARPQPPGGQGQPYPDEVVAEARALAEGTFLSQAEIAARVGVSQMSVSRWMRAGGWRRPRGTQRPFDELGQSLGASSATSPAPGPGGCWRRPKRSSPSPKRRKPTSTGWNERSRWC